MEFRCKDVVGEYAERNQTQRTCPKKKKTQVTNNIKHTATNFTTAEKKGKKKEREKNNKVGLNLSLVCLPIEEIYEARFFSITILQQGRDARKQ